MVASSRSLAGRTSTLRRQQGAEERLPGDPDQHRTVQLIQLTQPAQQFPVVLGGLGEADTRVDDQPVGGDSGPLRIGDLLAQLGHYLGHHVGVRGSALHVLGVAAPVHADIREAALGHQGQQLWIGPAAGDVVDQPNPGGDGLGGDLAAHRVDADAGAGGSEGPHDRNHPAQLLGHGRADRPGARGFATYLDDVGPLLDELETVGDRGLVIEPLTAVGEGVRRDVDHAHHDGSAGLRQARDSDQRAHPAHPSGRPAASMLWSCRNRLMGRPRPGGCTPTRPRRSVGQRGRGGSRACSSWLRSCWWSAS